jgi:hypothetical protein
MEEAAALVERDKAMVALADWRGRTATEREEMKEGWGFIKCARVVGIFLLKDFKQ